MTMQVSSVPEQTGLSNAAQQRSTFLARLLEAAQDSQPSLAWLQSRRSDATACIQEQSFPTTRDEEWRFTDLFELVQLPIATASSQVSSVLPDDIAAFVLPEVPNRIVFINGVYAPHLSAVADLPTQLTVGNLAAEGADVQAYLAQQAGAEELFTALNTAGLTDAAIVLVPKNLVVDEALHLLFITTADRPILVQPRVLVVAQPHSSVALIEEHVALNETAYLTNAVTEIWVEENAQVSHTRVQRDHQSAFHIGKTAVSQARTARYTCNAISLGAKLSRHNLEIYQTGEQTETTLNGLTVITGEQLGDLHSTIALTKPYGVTRQLHKTIVGDRAHAVFNGKVYVPRAAQLTDAGQLNRNLLLSPKARVDTKPQLEIVADNVKCTHGATVGQLDEDEVFYLQSRGIDADAARNLLVYAFAYEILDQIPADSLKQRLSQLVTTVGH